MTKCETNILQLSIVLVSYWKVESAMLGGKQKLLSFLETKLSKIISVKVEGWQCNNRQK